LPIQPRDDRPRSTPPIFEVPTCVRKVEQARASDGKRRTVGTYQVFHNGVKQTGVDLAGTVAEARGPGANQPAGINRRLEEGRYPLLTQAGSRFVTIGFNESHSFGATPRPALELKETGQRREILIHPGRGFLSALGSLNPCTALSDADEPIDFKGSRRRIVAMIEDLRAVAGAGFPERNGQRIPNAFVVIDGEPGPPG
jgi:hypothetical protein